MILSRPEAIMQDLKELDYLRRAYNNSNLDLDYETRRWLWEDYIITLKRFGVRWSANVIWDEESKSHRMEEL